MYLIYNNICITIYINYYAVKYIPIKKDIKDNMISMLNGTIREEKVGFVRKEDVSDGNTVGDVLGDLFKYFFVISLYLQIKSLYITFSFDISLSRSFNSFSSSGDISLLRLLLTFLMPCY